MRNLNYSVFFREISRHITPDEHIVLLSDLTGTQESFSMGWLVKYKHLINHGETVTLAKYIGRHWRGEIQISQIGNDRFEAIWLPAKATGRQVRAEADTLIKSVGKHTTPVQALYSLLDHHSIEIYASNKSAVVALIAAVKKTPALSWSKTIPFTLVYKTGESEYLMEPTIDGRGGFDVFEGTFSASGKGIFIPCPHVNDACLKVDEIFAPPLSAEPAPQQVPILDPHAYQDLDLIGAVERLTSEVQATNNHMGRISASLDRLLAIKEDRERERCRKLVFTRDAPLPDCQ